MSLNKDLMACFQWICMSWGEEESEIHQHGNEAEAGSRQHSVSALGHQLPHGSGQARAMGG